MEDHHAETVLKLLSAWQSLVSRESEAIAQGKLDDLEHLLQQSSLIQQRLERDLTASDFSRHDRRVLEMTGKLHKQQEMNMQALREQTDELAREIGFLRKNKSSLLGYKQNKAQSPRFKSERM